MQNEDEKVAKMAATDAIVDVDQVHFRLKWHHIDNSDECNMHPRWYLCVLWTYRFVIYVCWWIEIE